jgi:hypothetical protein
MTQVTRIEIPAKPGRGRPKGRQDANPRGGHKLTPDDVREIRRLHDAQTGGKISYAYIMSRFPQVSKQNIEQIVKRKIWKSVI